MARGVVLVLVVLVAMVAAAAAQSNSRYVETFPVAGLKCKLRNVPLTDGIECPEGNPSTVTFCKKRGRTLRIVGNFHAADLGVCDPSVNPYTLPAGTVVKYEQYGDQVVLRIPGRASSSFRCFLSAGKKVCVGVGSRYGVSYLKDCVPTAC